MLSAYQLAKQSFRVEAAKIIQACARGHKTRRAAKPPVLYVVVATFDEEEIASGRGKASAYAVLYASSAAEAKSHFVNANVYMQRYPITFALEAKPYTLGELLDEYGRFDQAVHK